MERRRIEDDNWVRCPYCRHKLFKKLIGSDALIEIKCSTCKRVFEVGLEDDERKNEQRW